MVTRFLWVVVAASYLVFSPSMNGSAATVEGELKVWHAISVDFRGPVASETDDEPNPFLDHRLQVRFTGPSGRTYDVPGFFAGDGEGGDGNVWRVRFSPDRHGTWKYQASFRKGPKVAVSLDPEVVDLFQIDFQLRHFVVFVGRIRGPAPFRSENLDGDQSVGLVGVGG